MILKETKNHINTSFAHLLEKLNFENLEIIQRFAVVVLGNGSLGISSLIEKTKSHFEKKDVDFNDFTRFEICGVPINEDNKTRKSASFVTLLGAARFNTISSGLLSVRNYKLNTGEAPTDFNGISSNTSEVSVESFQSYFEKCQRMISHFKKLEINIEANKITVTK